MERFVALNKNTLLAFILILLTFVCFSLYESYSAKRNRAAAASSGFAKGPAVETNRPAQQQVVPQITGETSAVAISAGADTSRVRAPAGDTAWIDNGKMLCGIAEVGARIVSLKMKDYGYDRISPKGFDAKERVDLVARSLVGGGNLSIDAENYDAKLFKLQDSVSRIRIGSGQKASLSFSYRTAAGTTVIKRYSFEGESYRIGLDILSPSLDGKSITVSWRCGITESEYLKGTSAQNSGAYVNEQRKVHVFGGKSIEHIQIKRPDDKIDPKTGFYKWAALTSKYFTVALVPDTVKDADISIEGYDSKEYDDVKAEGKKGPIVDYSVSIKRTGDGSREGYWLFAGPSKLSLLRSYRAGLEKVLFGGWEVFLRADLWFPYICEVLLWLLVYVNNLVKDYGVTIIILTIITRVITYPLSQSSMKSMNRMKLLQPKINHIRERYKTNPKKMNEEIMAMYREEGVNPLNPGCLPMFLQMPILIALYVVLQKAIELRGAHTVLVPWVKDLSQPEIFVALQSIPFVGGLFPNGLPWYGNGIAIMPVIMAILTFIQNRMTIKDPNQKAMIYFMPIFMLVIFNNLPAGLVFYWTFSNALGILQQYILNRSMEKEAVAYRAAAEKNQRSGTKARK
jgi:YidC/Oxa1 family membrane protein insertase